MGPLAEDFGVASAAEEADSALGVIRNEL